MAEARGKASRVKEAIGFVKEQKASLERRMAELKQAREEWKRDDLAARRDGGGMQRKFLGGVKEALDQQAHRLNAEVRQLQSVMQWLKLRRKQLAIMEAHEMSEKGPWTCLLRSPRHDRRPGRFGKLSAAVLCHAALCFRPTRAQEPF